MNDQWDDNPPAEEGAYWFAGWASGFEWRWNNYSDPPEMFMVNAKRIGSGKIMLDGRGEFLNAKEMRGKWQRIDVPAMPALHREDYNG